MGLSSSILFKHEASEVNFVEVGVNMSLAADNSLQKRYLQEVLEIRMLDNQRKTGEFLMCW